MKMESLNFNESENNFQNIIFQAPVAIGIIWGRGLIIKTANELFLELLGKSTRIIGFPLLETIPEMIGQPFPDLLLEVFDTGVAYHGNEMRTELMRNNKLEVCYFNFVYSPLKEGNHINGVIIIASEVTELVNAKIALQESENRFRHLVIDSPMPTAILLGRDMVIQLVNEAMHNLVSKDVSVCHKPLHEAMPELIAQPVLRLLDEAYTTGIIYHCEEQKVELLINKQLKCFYFNLSFKPLRHVDNQIYGILIKAVDITSLVIDKHKLVIAEERMRFALEASEMGTWVMYPLENAIESDAKCKELFGFTERQEPLKSYESILKYIHPDDVEYVNETTKLAGTPNHLGGYEIEFRIIREDKKLRWLRCKGKAYFTSEGVAYRFAGTALDITEEKRKEAALRNEENRFHTAFENAAVGMVILDLQDNIQQTNKAFSHIIGYSKEELSSINFKDITYPDDDIKNQHLTDRVFKNLLPALVLEKRYIKKDGSILWAKQSSALFYKENGEPDSFITIIQDISKGVYARDRLKSTNEELRNLVKQFTFVTDFMPQIVWAALPDGSQDFYNQRWYEYTGTKLEELKKSKLFEELHPDDQEYSRKSWKESLATGNPFECEYRLRRHDGVYRWFLSRALPLRDENFKILKWFGTCTDINEQKQLAQQKDSFLGIASHELKTPVTSIKAYAQVLEKILLKKGAFKEAEMINKIDLQINRLTKLIDDLLNVTRINSGKLPFNRTVFDFEKLASEIIEELQHSMSRHIIIKDFNYKGSIFGDRERIGQVITNLLTNAIKYSPYSTEIIVHIQLENQMVIMCVEDFGVGISKNNQPNVFDQFYRVTENKQHTFPGIGLGLYIAAEIVSRENGKIWIEKSAEGKGSTFCISLPVDENKLKDLH